MILANRVILIKEQNMNKHTLRALMVFSLYVSMICLPSFTYGAETLYLTLDESVDYAMKHNRTIRAYAQKGEGAQYKMQESVGSFLPQISASFNFTHMDAAPAMEIPAGMLGPMSPAMSLTTSQQEQRAVKGTVQQNLFTWGRIVNSYKQSRLGYEIAGIELEKAKLQLKVEVIRSFYGVILAQEVIRASEDAVKNAETHLENTKRNLAAGIASDFDVLRAEVQLANIKPQAIKVKNSLRLALFQFKNLLGIAEGIPVELAGKMKYDPGTYNLKEGINKVLLNRLELKQMKIQKEMSKTGIELASSGNKPSLSFLYSYSLANGQTSNKDEWKDSWNAMLNLNIPVFDGNITSSRVKQAESQLKELNIAEADLVQGIRLELEQIYYELKENEEIFTSQEKNVSQARRAQELAEARYKEGLATNADVTDAQQAFLQARVNMLQALYNYTVAQAKWEKAVGGQ